MIVNQKGIYIKDVHPFTTINALKKINVWGEFLTNPNLTWKDVVQNLDKKWHWGKYQPEDDFVYFHDSLSENSFNRYNAAITIQRWWRKKKYVRYC